MRVCYKTNFDIKHKIDLRLRETWPPEWFSLSHAACKKEGSTNNVDFETKIILKIINEFWIDLLNECSIYFDFLRKPEKKTPQNVWKVVNKFQKGNDDHFQNVGQKFQLRDSVIFAKNNLIFEIW